MDKTELTIHAIWNNGIQPYANWSSSGSDLDRLRTSTNTPWCVKQQNKRGPRHEHNQTRILKTIRMMTGRLHRHPNQMHRELPQEPMSTKPEGVFVFHIYSKLKFMQNCKWDQGYYSAHLTSDRTVIKRRHKINCRQKNLDIVKVVTISSPPGAGSTMRWLFGIAEDWQFDTMEVSEYNVSP